MLSDQIRFPFGGLPKNLDVMWRVEGQKYSVTIDAEREIFGTTPLQVNAYWYEITKRTPKGVWLGTRFVKMDARKRWACPTLKEAVESYCARKNRQIKILSAQLRDAERGLKIATQYLQEAE